MPDFGAAGVAPLLSHATARPDRLTRRYQARPQAAGRRFESQPIGPLNATTKPQRIPEFFNQAGMRALAPLPDSASRERTIGEVLALLTGAGEEATA
jgi:hypothetical protein